ncbi:STM4015 family protein [Rhizohabitans arisaemae]|uniref:STM4015 family protein n=1 Tax=Rhizohabitans arisaemae TaxID=2720610 RepID=UPI0024B04803|nr:STM4015 family protein [Rhizohabitans arisaemae]
MSSLHLTRFAGLPVRPVPAEGPLTGDVAWRMSVEYESKDTFDGLFDRFLALPGAERVRALVVGAWHPFPSEGHSSGDAVRRIAESAKRLPELRAIYLGDITQEESEISWLQQSDVTPLLEAYPALERLEVRGGFGLRLQPVKHASLQALCVESGGIPAEVVSAVSRSDLPALTELELWLGIEEYGGDATLADLAGILSGEGLPALIHLGLQNSEIQDEIATAVASAPIVARLETLALSMGTLTDDGAEALLSGQPLTHLRRLDLSHHYLTDAMMERVTAALPGVKVDLGDQEEPDDGEWFYVAVSE